MVKREPDPELDSACRYLAMREAQSEAGGPDDLAAINHLARRAKRRRPENGGTIRLRYRARSRLWDIDVRALWNVEGWKRPFWVGPFRTARGAATLQLDEPL